MNDPELQEVRAILADLQNEIRRHRMILGEPEEVTPDPILNVRAKQTVNPHLPIGWPNMPKGLLPKLSAYAQKITRRLLRWYINPIVAQQNEYNAAVTEVLANLCRQVDEHTGGLAAVQRQEERQEQDLETLRLRLQRTENWRRDSQLSAPPATPPPAPVAIDYFLLAASIATRCRWPSASVITMTLACPPPGPPGRSIVCIAGARPGVRARGTRRASQADGHRSLWP